METIKSKVLYVLEKDLEVMITSLDQKLELDSMEEVELVMCLEDEFAIVIPDWDIEGFTTPNKIMEYIEKSI